MKIKITTENKLAIESALKVANGNAENFVFSTLDEIQSLAEEAEIFLENIRLPSSERHGAAVLARSGEQVAQSYGFSRNVTSVELQRGSTDWFLVKAERIKAGPYAKRPSILLTAEQDSVAVNRLRSLYSIHRDNVESQIRPDTETTKLPCANKVEVTA